MDLEVNDLVLIRTEINRVEDPLDHIRAVAGQQRGDVDVALLQLLVRIELVDRALQLPVRRFITRHLRTHETRFQSIELIVDLLSTGIECARE